MPEPLTCADLAAAVVEQPVPVVFLDTAAILDVLRVPFRHELQADVVESAVSVANDALTDLRRVWLITTANVLQELENRREGVESELVAQMTALQRMVNLVLPIAKTTFPKRQIIWPNLLELGLTQRIVRIMDHLLDSIIVFTGTAVQDTA
jgi:hypothetical protein